MALSFSIASGSRLITLFSATSPSAVQYVVAISLRGSLVASDEISPIFSLSSSTLSQCAVHEAVADTERTWGEGDYQSFFVILHVRAVFLEPALMVIEMFLFRFKVNIRYVIGGPLLISKSPPACLFEAHSFISFGRPRMDCVTI